MTPYSTDSLNTLLTEAGLSAYAAAPMAGIKPRQMQNAAAGHKDLSPAAWTLLQVTLSRSARAQLPPALVD